MRRAVLILVSIFVFAMTFGGILTIGHHGPINSVAMSIDGKMAVTAGGWPDPVMRIWDLRAGEMKMIVPFEGYVGAVAMSPDGRYIAGGGMTGVIYVWDSRKGKWVSAFTGHTSPITAMTIDPSGRYVVSGDSSGIMKVWKIGRIGPYKSYFAHDSGITDLSFSPDGRFLVSTSLDGKIKVWSDFYRNPVVTIDYGRPVTTAIVLPSSYTQSGKMTIVAGDGNGDLIFWKVEPKSEAEFIESYEVVDFRKVRAHSGKVADLVLNADGTLMASGGEDGIVKLWDPSTGKLLRNVGRMERPVTSLAMTLDGRVLGADSGGNMILWRSREGRVLRVFEGSPMVKSVDSEGDHTVVGYVDGTVKVYDASRGSIDVFKDHTLPVGVKLMEGKIVSAGEDGRLVIRSGKGWNDRSVLMQRSSPFKVISKGESYFATVDDKGNIKVWDLENRGIYTMIVSGDNITSAVLDEANRRLITGNDKGYLRVWDIDEGIAVSSTRIGFMGIRSVDVTRDGRYIVVVGDDGYVRILDGRDFIEISHFKPLLKGAKDLAFLDSPYVIAVAGSEDMIEIWNWSLREIENVLISENDVLVTVDYNPSKHVVAGGGYKGVVYLWNLEGDLIGEFVGFADGEYVVESEDRIEISKGIREGKVVGVELEGKKRMESKSECGTLSGERLDLSYTATGLQLELLAVSKDVVYSLSKKWILALNTKTAHLKRIENPDGEIDSISSSSSGDLVMGTKSGKVLIYRALDGSFVNIGGHTGRVFDVKWSDSLGYPISVGVDGNLIVWKSEPLKIYAKMPYSLAILDGSRVVVGCRDGYLRVYDLNGGKVLKSVKAHDDYVIFVGYFEGKLVSVGWDDRIKVWNAETLDLIREIRLRYPIIYETVALSRDGKMAFVNYRGSLEVRDLNSGVTVRLIDVGEDVTDVRFLEDKVIVTSKRGTVSIYDVDSGDKISEFFITESGYMAFRKDGVYLAEGLKPQDYARPIAVGPGRKRDLSFEELCNVDSFDVLKDR